MLFIVVFLSIFFWLSGVLGSILLLKLELFRQFLTTIRLKLKRAETRYMFLPLVRVEGLEPPSLAAPDPKSGVSTNFTTPALGMQM
jgi:hypothetical protein